MIIFLPTHRDRNLQAIRQIGVSPQSIASFTADERGGICVAGYEGMVYKLGFARAVFK